jgi:hypothetical protein
VNPPSSEALSSARRTGTSRKEPPHEAPAVADAASADSASRRDTLLEQQAESKAPETRSSPNARSRHGHGAAPPRHGRTSRQAEAALPVLPLSSSVAVSTIAVHRLIIDSEEVAPFGRARTAVLPSGQFVLITGVRSVCPAGKPPGDIGRGCGRLWVDRAKGLGCVGSSTWTPEDRAQHRLVGGDSPVSRKSVAAGR